MKISQTISLQDYVKRLWNHSNTKIPVTIGKGTDTAKPRSKAPYRGNKAELRCNVHTPPRMRHYLPMPERSASLVNPC